MHEEDELMRRFDNARENLTRLRQTEHVSGSPVTNTGSNAEPNNTWPMVIYVLPNGDVIARRELTVEVGSTHLAHRSQLVMRIHPHREPGNSDGGAEFSIEVVKFRGDMGNFFRSVARAYLTDPDSERALIQSIFPNVRLPENE